MCAWNAAGDAIYVSVVARRMNEEVDTLQIAAGSQGPVQNVKCVCVWKSDR